MADVGVQFLRRLMVYLMGKKNPYIEFTGFSIFSGGERGRMGASFSTNQQRDNGERFMLTSSVTSCRSSADETATVSHFPSGYARASS
jgi:hypothetical protein